MLISWLKPIYDETDPPGGGGGDDDTPARASDLLARYGRDADAALRLAEELARVQGEAYRLREQRRQLRAERDALKATQAPEDAVILSKDDAALLDAYKALGAPEVVKQALDAAQTATQEVATLRRAETIRAAAEAHRYKPAVLARLASDLTLTVKDGKDGPVAYVVLDGAETALPAYAEKEWADFLPSLAVETKPVAPNINGGDRGGSNGHTITDEERARITRRYQSTF